MELPSEIVIFGAFLTTFWAPFIPDHSHPNFHFQQALAFSKLIYLAVAPNSRVQQRLQSQISKPFKASLWHSL